MALNPAQDPVLHLLRRATYGPTPALAAEVRRTGTTAWLDAQLHPLTAVPDTAMDTLARRYPRQCLAVWQARDQLAPDDRWALMQEAVDLHIARATWSRRQLLEVLADFWSNHLNVTCPSSDVWDSRHLYAQRRHPEARPGHVLRHARGLGQAPRHARLPRQRQQLQEGARTRTTAASCSSCTPSGSTAATPRRTSAPRPSSSPACRWTPTRASTSTSRSATTWVP